jgi:hypothetical protein
MKASTPFNLLILILVLSNGIAFAQPGYYPPPSSINYQTDTLTIHPPDSVPGDPVVLIGYNIYIDDVFSGNVMVSNPLETVDYYLDDESMLPGTRVICAKTVYNDWISESSCDTSEIIYGYDLPFLEDWSSGNFEENQWIISSDHWQIETGDGNPLPAAVFRGEPGLTNYEARLESHPFNTLDFVNGSMMIEFDLKLESSMASGEEFLKVQVWNLESQSWADAAVYSNADGSFGWIHKQIGIAWQDVANIFMVRFIAAGTNSTDINGWFLDNINVNRECFIPENYQVVFRTSDVWGQIYNSLSWTQPDLGWLDWWIRWDDGVNAGNSLGNGDASELDVAIRFTPEQLAPYEGLSVVQISFFPVESSANYAVRVWQGENADSLCAEQVAEDPEIGSWNYITLSNPWPVDVTKELWVGYHFSTPTGYPAGVDDGPAVDGYGNMIYWEGGWKTLLEINPELDFNWNIAALMYTSVDYPKTYFKIYRQENLEGFELYDSTASLHYDDYWIGWELYCYQVSMVTIKDGDTCESDRTEMECEYVKLNENPVIETNVRIFPNPASSVLNITSPEKINEVRIYNMLGECELKLEIGNWEGRVDVSCLQSGIYFVEVMTEESRTLSKILIIR